MFIILGDNFCLYNEGMGEEKMKVRRRFLFHIIYILLIYTPFQGQDIKMFYSNHFKLENI